MENFEKWIETQNGLVKYDEITSKAAKLAWKAALEWALIALWVEFEDTDLSTVWYGGPIEEELEDE